jgi:hypothetical protein
VERELHVSVSPEFAGEPGDLDTGFIWPGDEGDRVRHFCGKCLGLRSAHRHHNRRVQVGAVQLPQRRHGVTDLGDPLARCYHGQAEFAELVLDPRPSGADAHLEATLAKQ